MKRNLFYFAIVIILGTIAFFIFNKKDTGSFESNEAEFKVSDTASIGKIFLADLKGNTILVERKEGYWEVNNSFHARPEIVQSLLITFMQLEVNAPVAKSMYNTVVRDIAGDHIKVEIYNRKNKKLKSYFIGSPNSSYRGNFMLMEGSKVPFVVTIPGFQGFVSSRFFLEPDQWKDRSIFAYNPAAIIKVEVEYPHIPDSSFTILRTNDSVFTMQSTTSGTMNPELGRYFFNQFKRLNCEFYVIDNFIMDSLLQEKPVCIITVTNNEGKENTVDIYFKPIGFTSRTQFAKGDVELSYDVDKFYAIFNDKQSLAVIQNFVFGKLFIGPHYFYRTRPAQENLLLDAITKPLAN
ncbi:MAG: hypothetical protein WAU21_14270 [Chitinophagales bacterium]|nr:hypothetical protein [Bacteroidota bacterium]MBK8681049.1 hypothetical protein [Bacteroidota bacterium]